MATMKRQPLWLLIVLVWQLPVITASTEQEPKFTMDFPLIYDFSNTTGGMLACTAQGQPQPNITWLMVDGTPVTYVPKLRQILHDGTLQFPSFGIDDFRQDIHGVSYRCAAANALGTVVSNEIKVKGVVNQIFDIHVYDVYTIKQNSAIMRCHIPKFVQSFVNITAWIKDSVVSITESNFNANSKYVLLPSGELIIKDVDSNDALTTYQCQVLNRLTGEVKLSNPGRLIVTESQGKIPPKIVFGNSHYIIAEGEKLILPCLANGNPVPNYTWTKESMSGEFNSVSPNDDIIISFGLLIIENAQDYHEGKYICTASNEVNSAKLTIEVTIIEPLVARINPTKAIVDANNKVSLNCKINGSPIQNIIWFKDGKPLPESSILLVNNQTITISDMGTQHVGIYQCFATNDLYSSFDSAVIQLGDSMPEILKGFEEQILKPHAHLLLECTARGNPVPQFVWTLDNVKLIPNERIIINMRSDEVNDVISSLRISNVNVEDGGVYRCTAKTNKGLVDHTARIFIHGKLGVRSNVKYQAIEDSDAQIECPVYGVVLLF